MNLGRIILLVLFISTDLLNAQTDFKPGYIINSKGDTVKGEIDYRSDMLMSRLCKFKGVDDIVTEFSPNDIMAFRFIDGKYFVSREVNHKKVFLEYLINGKVNIYYMRDKNGDHYFLDKEGVKMSEILYEIGVKRINGKQVHYESKKHIGLLNYYMKDASGFQKRIQTIGMPEHQNLIKLAEDYHNAVCSNEACIIYEKELPAVRIHTEFIAGLAKYFNVDKLNDKYFFQSGIITHVWLPRSNEKLYFRTGLMYSRLNFEDGGSNYFKIPCQFEYIYPKGFFRPRVAYGFNFYIPTFQSVSFNLGANVKLNEKIFLSIGSEFEFYQKMMIIPKDRLSNYLHIGLFIGI